MVNLSFLSLSLLVVCVSGNVCGPGLRRSRNLTLFIQVLEERQATTTTGDRQCSNVSARVKAILKLSWSSPLNASVAHVCCCYRQWVKCGMCVLQSFVATTELTVASVDVLSSTGKRPLGWMGM